MYSRETGGGGLLEPPGWGEEGRPRAHTEYSDRSSYLFSTRVAGAEEGGGVASKVLVSSGLQYKIMFKYISAEIHSYKVF